MSASGQPNRRSACGFQVVIRPCASIVTTASSAWATSRRKRSSPSCCPFERHRTAFRSFRSILNHYHFHARLPAPQLGLYREWDFVEPRVFRDSLLSGNRPRGLGKTLTSVDAFWSMRLVSFRSVRDGRVPGGGGSAPGSVHVRKRWCRLVPRRSVLAPTPPPSYIETEVADSGARSWPAASGRGVLGTCERGP